MCLPLAMICLGHFARCFIYSFISQVINEKILCGKGFTTYLREVFNESSYGYNFWKFGQKFAIIPLFCFRKNLKEKSDFQLLRSLVTENLSGFCL